MGGIVDLSTIASSSSKEDKLAYIEMEIPKTDATLHDVQILDEASYPKTDADFHDEGVAADDDEVSDDHDTINSDLS